MNIGTVSFQYGLACVMAILPAIQTFIVVSDIATDNVTLGTAFAASVGVFTFIFAIGMACSVMGADR